MRRFFIFRSFKLLICRQKVVIRMKNTMVPVFEPGRLTLSHHGVRPCAVRPLCHTTADYESRFIVFIFNSHFWVFPTLT